MTALFRQNFDSAQDPRTAANALRLQVGVHTQAWAALLDSVSSLAIVQGDLLYGTSANALTRLPKDTNATRYLSNTGTSNAPAWAQVNLANGVTGTAALANLQGHPTATTDNVAVRFDGTAGFTQTSALVIADTTAALSRSGNGGIPVQGTNTNDSASAGFVGEYVESIVGSGASLSSGAALNVTSISLSAGDWDVAGVIAFSMNGNVTQTVANIATSSGAAGTSGNPGRSTPSYAFPAAAVANVSNVNISPCRVLLASAGSAFLVALATFTSTATANGSIWARRLR